MTQVDAQRPPRETEATERGFERRLEALHQMLYRRGGIRPVNAAIEELSKLLLLRIKCACAPDWELPGHGSIAEILDPERIRRTNDVGAVKSAFRATVRLAEFAGRLPGGGTQPIWPLDEPLRLDRADVVAEALEILDDHAPPGSGEDALGTAFDVFLRGRYDHAGGLGTYLTPHQVTTSLARLTLADLDLLTGDIHGPLAGDPCCGTGRFLIAILQELESKVAKDESNGRDPRRLQRQLDAFRRYAVFGADQSSSSVAKARINLLLYGVQHPNVFTVEDSIVSCHVDTLRGTLKLILTNPPFGDGQYDSAPGIARTAEYLPTLARRKQIDPAVAFVVRCLGLLDHGGRLGIILPDGLVDGSVLRNALLREGDTRIRDVSIEANISLPTVTFAPAGTTAKTSAVVIRKQRASRSTVYLARAAHIGYIRQGGEYAADPAGDDLPPIAELGVQAWTEPDGLTEAASEGGVEILSQRPLAAVVAREDLQSVDPSRVDPDALRAHAELRRHGGIRLGELLTPQSRKAERARGGLPFVSVLHIDELGAVAWQEAENHRPATPGPPAYRGELIVSLLNPRKLRATVIPDEYSRVLCSSEFAVFSVGADPYEALVLLHDARVRAQLAPLGRGTSSSRRRIETGDLLDAYAPRIEPRELKERASRLRAALGQLRTSVLAAAAAYGQEPRAA